MALSKPPEIGCAHYGLVTLYDFGARMGWATSGLPRETTPQLVDVLCCTALVYLMVFGFWKRFESCGAHY